MDSNQRKAQARQMRFIITANPNHHTTTALSVRYKDTFFQIGELDYKHPS